MAVIGQRTFSDGVDRYIALSNESLVRPIAIGTNWTSLRVSVLCAIDYQEAVSLGGAQFMIGLCSGTSNPYSSATTTNYIGMGFHRFPPTGTFTYNAGTGNPYLTGSGNGAITKTGTTQVTVSGNTFSHYFPVAGVGVPRRMIHSFVFTKGIPNYSITYYNNTADPLLNYTQADLLEVCDQIVVGTNILVNGVSVAGSGFTVAASEAAGVFDTVDIYWNKVPPMEIYGLGVTRCA